MTLKILPTGAGITQTLCGLNSFNSDFSQTMIVERGYLYKPWAFDTILIYLYMCVIVVSVNISE